MRIVVAGERSGLASPLPALQPARPTEGLWTMEPSEPGSTLNPGLSRGDAWPGSEDGVTVGFGCSSQESLGSRRGSSGWVFSQGPRLCTARMGRGDCAGVCLTACLLLTAELSYPKPSISLRPSEGVTLGGAVTIRCRGRHQNVRFLLYKDGNPNLLQDVEPAGDMAEFPIRNVSRRRGGNYRCSYRSKSDRPVQSEPSDPVELVVAGEEPGSAAPLPAPHPGSLCGDLCADGTLRARLCPEPWVKEERFSRSQRTKPQPQVNVQIRSYPQITLLPIL
uniref:Ig-like domain-containing protein n=1 Tax=Terrapene triunguis TaxID=2587831 RepID=A0A674JZG4_9SAUR